MSRDGYERVRGFEALLKICEIKIVAGARLITCSNSDTYRRLIVYNLIVPQRHLYMSTSVNAYVRIYV